MTQSQIHQCTPDTLPSNPGICLHNQTLLDADSGSFTTKADLNKMSHTSRWTSRSTSESKKYLSLTEKWHQLLSIETSSTAKHRIRQKSSWYNAVYNRVPFQFSSVAQSCSTLCDPMNRSTPGLPVHHYLLECPLDVCKVHWERWKSLRTKPSPSLPANNLGEPSWKTVN